MFCDCSFTHTLAICFIVCITLQVVASQDWPEVTKYAGLVSAQSHRQELIEDLYKVTHDPQKGTICGGMIRYASKAPLLLSFLPRAQVIHAELHICRELLISFKRSTGQKPQRILFYRCVRVISYKTLHLNCYNWLVTRSVGQLMWLPLTGMV